MNMKINLSNFDTSICPSCNHENTKKIKNQEQKNYSQICNNCNKDYRVTEVHIDKKHPDRTVLSNRNRNRRGIL